MLTIFTIPKPFRGATGTQQRNAVGSWVSIRPKCEVILLGDEPGTAECASELGARHIPELGRNRFGTPLLSDAFASANRFALGDCLAYVNGDMILLDDFAGTVERMVWPRFLLLGHRWDLDFDEPIDFSEPRWQADLRSAVTVRGELHDDCGIDYFVFPKGLWPEMPPFAVGRPAWDNWMVADAKRRGMPVIDATAVVTAIHQNHDYSHTTEKRDGRWRGPESEYNKRLARGIGYILDISDAEWVLDAGDDAPRLKERPGLLRSLGRKCSDGMLAARIRVYLSEPRFLLHRIIRFVRRRRGTTR